MDFRSDPAAHALITRQRIWGPSFFSARRHRPLQTCDNPTVTVQAAGRRLGSDDSA